MDSPFFIAVVAALATPIGIFVGWLLNRKKNVADIYSVLSEASQASVEMMRSTMETINEELVANREKVERLIKENIELTRAVNELKEANAKLIKENAELRQQIKNLSDFLSVTDDRKE